MSRADVEAGKAHVTLYVNNLMTKGLRDAQAQLQGFGRQMMGIGTAVAGLGAAILAPLGMAVGKFAEMGSELDDLSKRTGLAASNLSQLKYAAEQSGATLQDIEKAVLQMQKAGLTETFDQVAARIAAIEDPAERTRQAIEAWGRSGVKLLPMVADLAALRAESDAMGFTVDDASVAKAAALGDAFDKVKTAVAAVMYQVGAALADAILPAAEAVAKIVGSVANWAKENAGVVRTIAAIGGGLLVAGTAVAAIGAGIFAAGAVLGGLATVVSTIGAVLAAVTSPLGLITIGVVAATVAFFKFTDAGRNAASEIGKFFSPLFDFMRTGLGGIADALMSGDISLAAQIAVKTIQAVFQTGIASIAGMIGGTLGDTLGSLATDVIAGDFARAWETVTLGIAAGWDVAMANMYAATSSLIDQVDSLLNQATKRIQRIIATVAKFADNPLVGGAIGGDALRAIGKGLGTVESFRSDAFATGGSAADALAEHFAKAAKGSGADFRTRISGGAAGADDAAAALAAELEELRKRAADARAGGAAGAGGPALPDIVPDVAAAARAASSTFGTFSAAGALAQGVRADGPVVGRLDKLIGIEGEGVRKLGKLEALLTVA